MINDKIYVLLADADLSLSTVLADYLKQHNFEVDKVSDGKQALECLRSNYYDICIMDISLGKMNGFEVLEHLRKDVNSIPVIILSARNAVEDITRAYNIGCDEYVTKPFSIDILICKIRAIVRRCTQHTQSQETQFVLGGIPFDSVRQQLGTTHLSGRESDLLLMLCRQQEQIVDRHVLLCTLWQTDDQFASRSLSVYVNHLRKHLTGTGYKILGVHGKGYKLVSEKSATTPDK